MANDNAPELQSIWDEAKGYIERGDFDKAIDIYKYILIIMAIMPSLPSMPMPIWEASTLV